MKKREKSEFEEILESINYSSAPVESDELAQEDKPKNIDYSSNSDMETTQVLDTEVKFFSVGYSKNIGKRKSQQDSVAVSADNYLNPCTENRILAVLSDGMGGLNGGEVASKLCVSEMIEQYNEQNAIDDYPMFFKNAIMDIDMQIKNLKSENGSPLGGGATLVSFAIDNDDLYWATVGDSHLYIIRNDEIVLVNREHNLMLRLMERVKTGDITLEEAKNTKRKDALISFMGMGGLHLYDINKTPFKMKTGDIVLACSDGLYRTLSDDEIKNASLRCNEDMQLLSHILISNALAKEKRNQDNLSVIIVKKI